MILDAGREHFFELSKLMTVDDLAHLLLCCDVCFFAHNVLCGYSRR